MTRIVDALAAAGTSARLRKPPTADAPYLEVDLEVPRVELPRIAEALEALGFRRWFAPGRGGHRFFVGYAAGRWAKVDVVLSPRPRAHPVRDAIARRVPSFRRLGAVVAFVGPDGAGKGTVLAEVRAGLPVASQIVYLGGTGGGRTGAGSGAPGPRRGARLRRRLEPLFVARLMLRHAHRLVGVYAAAARGRIVLCDRHPIEALAIRPRRTRSGATIEAVVVRRLLPWPDAVVVLDAPSEVLVDRKPEHPIETLDRWRERYRSELVPAGAHVVRTDRSLAQTVADASAIVWRATAIRRGWEDHGSNVASGGSTAVAQEAHDAPR